MAPEEYVTHIQSMHTYIQTPQTFLRPPRFPVPALKQFIEASLHGHSFWNSNCYLIWLKVLSPLHLHATHIHLLSSCVAQHRHSALHGSKIALWRDSPGTNPKSSNNWFVPWCHRTVNFYSVVIVVCHFLCRGEGLRLSSVLCVHVLDSSLDPTSVSGQQEVWITLLTRLLLKCSRERHKHIVQVLCHWLSDRRWDHWPRLAAALI